MNAIETYITDYEMKHPDCLGHKGRRKISKQYFITILSPLEKANPSTLIS